jgi:flap endonuclease-1
MGIKGLNHYLRKMCSQNIRQLSLYDLNGKVVAVDASIYMYRFKSDDSLIDGIYQMAALLKHCGIVPIFVFDGKPPPNKTNTLQKRQAMKHESEKQYRELSELFNNRDIDHILENTENEIKSLRKKFVRLTFNDIDNVKALLSFMGISYYVCSGEADAVCARMVHDNIAYACMSEDMDMFVYGTTIVLRYLSLLNSSVIIYDLNGILETLGLSFKEFQDICMITGTDYNISISTEVDINYSLKMFANYRASGDACNYSDWMIKTKSYIDAESLYYTIKLFDISELKLCPNKLTNSDYNEDGIKQFLESYGFIFAH